jgi:hypothetical protein
LKGGCGPAIIPKFGGTVQDDGFLGYMQSTVDDPSDGQRLSARVPDFEDCGFGSVLLGGSELVKLAER